MKSSDIPTLMVKLGDHDINTETETATQNIKVAQIIKHKGFSQSTLVSYSPSHRYLNRGLKAQDWLP